MYNTNQQTTTTPLILEHRTLDSTDSSNSKRGQTSIHRAMATPHWILQILLVIALFSSAHALLGSDDEQANAFNNEISSQDLPDTDMKSRLETLLELRRSIKALMEQKDDLSSVPDSIDDKTIDNPEEKEIVTVKRVFCNGFTGCGGRFREARAHQLALEAMKKRIQKAKRPFCNTNGCFNGGKRKRDRSNQVVLDGKTYIVDDGSQSSSSLNGFSGMSSENSAKQKRLFCNGYGGCQNMGKRGLLIPLLAGNQPSLDKVYAMDKTPKSKFEMDLQPAQEKRFYASSYDSKMDELMSRING